MSLCEACQRACARGVVDGITRLRGVDTIIDAGESDANDAGATIAREW